MTEMTDQKIDELDTLAQLLPAEGDERERVREDLSRMLDYVGKLREKDTTGVEPMVQPGVEVLRRDSLRQDEVASFESAQELISGAPALQQGLVEVPRSI